MGVRRGPLVVAGPVRLLRRPEAEGCGVSGVASDPLDRIEQGATAMLGKSSGVTLEPRDVLAWVAIIRRARDMVACKPELREENRLALDAALHAWEEGSR